MATVTRIDANTVLDKMWEPLKRGSKIYVVLDAAHDPTVFDTISPIDSALYGSLFAGTLLEGLSAAAPYLVQLNRRTKFPRELIEAGWGDSWGIFLESSDTLEALQAHLRELLLVKDETGRSLHFRFYDPRILRTYLPTCNAVELATFFGPIARFYTEGEAPNQLMHYALESEKLQTETIEIQSIA